MEKWKNGHEINLEKGGKKKIGGGVLVFHHLFKIKS
jgi:hypothetical protein